MVNLDGPRCFPAGLGDDDEEELMCGECSEDESEETDHAVEDLVDHLNT